MTREEYEILFEIMKDIASEYDQHDGYLPNEDSIKETGWYRLQHLIPPSEPIV